MFGGALPESGAIEIRVGATSITRMSQTDRRIDVESLTPLHWVGIAAAAISAGVHLYLSVPTGGTFGAAFVVASAGFIGGIAAILANYRRRLVYLLGIPFTGGQIVMWYVFNEVPPISPIEGIDKVSQAVLILVLAFLFQRGS